MKRIGYVNTIVQHYSYDSIKEYEEHKSKLESEGYDLLTISHYGDDNIIEAKYEKVLEWETE